MATPARVGLAYDGVVSPVSVRVLRGAGGAAEAFPRTVGQIGFRARLDRFLPKLNPEVLLKETSACFYRTMVYMWLMAKGNPGRALPQ